MASDLDSALKDADTILLLVNHTQFRNLDPVNFASKTSARLVVDTVNTWNGESWKSAGFHFHRLGDNKSPVSNL